MWEIEANCRRIPDTTPWTKPLRQTYGDWFLACVRSVGLDCVWGPMSLRCDGVFEVRGIGLDEVRQ